MLMFSTRNKKCKWLVKIQISDTVFKKLKIDTLFTIVTITKFTCIWLSSNLPAGRIIAYMRTREESSSHIRF